MNPLHDPARRRLMQALAAASASAMPALSFADPVPAMLKRMIPASGEALPAVGLGTYQSFDVGAGAAQREPVKEVLRLFAQQGGTLVDSSPMYGRSESVVGDLSEELGQSGRLFMATKVWTSGREAGIGQMQESLRRMKVERMDLMQIHNLLDWKTHLGTLQQWKAQGRVRYIGITHYHAGAYAELERLMKTKDFDFVQFNYSIAEREAEERILPLARESGVAVIINRPFAQASLFSRVRGKEVPSWAAEFDCKSWGQFFLKYILGHDAVTCVIPATSNPRHLIDNMMAGIGRLPDAAMRARMVAHMSSL
ncbi:MAG TPA: aldo/keto reductase [Burkholderiales bacterium]